MSRDSRADVLRQAATAKRTAATARAEAGLRKLIKANAEINFRSVAAAGGVSVDFLYRHVELRGRIEHLRARQQAKPHPASTAPDPTASPEANVVTALTASLRQARNEVAGLKTQLAVAHGDLLALRRLLPPAATDR